MNTTKHGYSREDIPETTADLNFEPPQLKKFDGSLRRNELQTFHTTTSAHGYSGEDVPEKKGDVYFQPQLKKFDGSLRRDEFQTFHTTTPSHGYSREDIPETTADLCFEPQLKKFDGSLRRDALHKFHTTTPSHGYSREDKYQVMYNTISAEFTRCREYVPENKADDSEVTGLSHAVQCRAIIPDHELCSILGLSEYSEFQLNEIDEEERAHETDNHLIRNIFEGAYKLLSQQYERLEKSFISRVFSEEKALEFSSLLEDSLVVCQQSVLYWGQRFIDDKFAYVSRLSDNTKPFDPDSGYMTVNNTCRVTDERGIPETTHVPTTYARHMDDIESFMSKIPEGKNVVFFHGTDAVSGRRIVENGILLGEGNRRQDFSDGYGFYVTENGRTALGWARHGNFAPSAAVVAFKVRTNVLEGFNKLDITDDMDTWKQIINYNRCGRDRRRLGTSYLLPGELQETLEKADYVEGKKWRKEAGSNRETTEVWPRDDLVPQDDTQVCIRTDDLADAVGDVRNISVCFFEKKSL